MEASIVENIGIAAKKEESLACLFFISFLIVLTFRMDIVLSVSRFHQQ